MHTFIKIFLSPTLCALMYTTCLVDEPFSILLTGIDTFDCLVSMFKLSSAEIYIFEQLSF